MKLSDIRGDEVFDVIADIIEPVCRIAEDKEAAALFTREKCPDGMEPREFVAARLRKAAPKLLKAHKDDLVCILAAINMVPVEDYRAELTLTSLIGDLLEMFTDEVLVSFFMQQGETEDLPGSA